MMKRRNHGKRRGGIYWIFSLLLLAAGMILPAMAVMKATAVLGSKVVTIYFGAISLVTAVTYRSDKRKAQAEAWRTPESRLHFLELMGGWGSAFVCQRLFRHKITKRPYQVSFWLIAVVHHFAAFDYLHDWHYSELAYQTAKPFLLKLQDAKRQ